MWIYLYSEPISGLLAKAWWLDYNLVRPGRGSVRLERTVRVREVPSSNLGAPTGKTCGVISFGRLEGDFYINRSMNIGRLGHCVHYQWAVSSESIVYHQLIEYNNSKVRIAINNQF